VDSATCFSGLAAGFLAGAFLLTGLEGFAGAFLEIGMFDVFCERKDQQSLKKKNVQRDLKSSKRIRNKTRRKKANKNLY